MGWEKPKKPAPVPWEDVEEILAAIPTRDHRTPREIRRAEKRRKV
jgi:hypothetical protein